MAAGDTYSFQISKRTVLFASLIVISILATIGIGEFLLRFLAPQDLMIPRYQFSERLGLTLPSSTTMIHRKPGKWEFRYTINHFGYRGTPIPIRLEYDTPVIVVLGDSNTMGIGVNDGEEYPAILARQLKGDFDIVNLGIGGFGLAQAIRHYVEFGRLYRPAIVIIQFNSNDVADNLIYPVATVENGRLEFHNVEKPWGSLKQLLADSFIQHSQLYNFLRNFAFRLLQRRELAQRMPQESSNPDAGAEFYNELLEAFALQLNADDVHVIFIATNNSLDRYHSIEDKVLELDRRHVLQYVEVTDWFSSASDYSAPDGHIWGAKGHSIVGRNLTDVIVQIRKPIKTLDRTPTNDFL